MEIGNLSNLEHMTSALKIGPSITANSHSSVYQSSLLDDVRNIFHAFAVELDMGIGKLRPIPHSVSAPLAVSGSGRRPKHATAIYVLKYWCIEIAVWALTDCYLGGQLPEAWPVSSQHESVPWCTFWTKMRRKLLIQNEIYPIKQLCCRRNYCFWWCSPRELAVDGIPGEGYTEQPRNQGCESPPVTLNWKIKTTVGTAARLTHTFWSLARLADAGATQTGTIQYAWYCTVPSNIQVCPVQQVGWNITMLTPNLKNPINLPDGLLDVLVSSFRQDVKTNTLGFNISHAVLSFPCSKQDSWFLKRSVRGVGSNAGRVQKGSIAVDAGRGESRASVEGKNAKW
ncbi:hypothetical protein Taro_015428 [Colocasia esculenta]|uniref:Uncharacterized protein n=1 Tax=Colocasia esculenta TaxID=4460 RepID=A0A843UHG8_COLES|nr:hypothetical protein [Colocasia esculenta]